MTAKCIRAVQQEQQDNAQPWLAVKEWFTAAATPKRLQWTIIDHDPFVRCLHHERVVAWQAAQVCNGGESRCTKAMKALLEAPCSHFKCLLLEGT